MTTEMLARQLVFVEHLSYFAAGKQMGMSAKGVWRLCNPRIEIPCEPPSEGLAEQYRDAHPRGKLVPAESYRRAHPRANGAVR